MANARVKLLPAVICLIAVAFRYCDAEYELMESSDKCINIKKCEPVLRLLRVPMIKKKIFGQVRRAHCGFEGKDHKIYCDVEKIIYKPERFEPVLAAHSTMSNDSPPLASRSTAINEHPNYRLLEQDICGAVPQNHRNQVKTRIVGGRATEIDEFPWMALLAYREVNYDGGKSQFRCSATVINRNHVLTAAHCVDHLPNRFKLISVRVGEHDLGSEHDCDSTNKVCNGKYEDFDIEQVYSHADYSNDNLQNDIAVVRLKGSIDFTRTHVRPICLPLDQNYALPNRGIVTGWGSTGDESPGSRLLLKVTLPIWSAESCMEAYSKLSLNIKLWHKQFCAGGYRAMDSCSGDSGGPLQTLSTYEGGVRMVQRGIVSYGRRNCGMENSPGVYTSVAHYMHWILDKIRA